MSVLPLTLLVAIFAHGISAPPDGVGVADASTDVFRILAVGYGINALAQVPLVALQGLGAARDRPLHLVQLVPDFAGLGVATATFGIRGAAVAWTLPVTIDMLGMWRLLHLG